jgi:monofunctional glycosyltransferase
MKRRRKATFAAVAFYHRAIPRLAKAQRGVMSVPMNTRAQSFKRSNWFVRWVVYPSLYAIGIALILILLFALLPVPTTFTMLTDPNGVERDWVPLEDISPNMVRAVIAAEDSKFCSHNGFDRQAIEQAVKQNARGGRVRGGSTISQQTAKNVFLWQNGGYFRKGLEAVFTFAIENIWGKRRIMEVYINVAETGIGTYGVEAAAQRYFQKPASKLTVQEAARIAANLPQPKTRPVINPDGFTRRYGNAIAARVAVVKENGLDECIY